MGLAKFMAQMPGRLIRIVAGVALIVVGLFVMGGSNGEIGGIIVAVIGILPILAGAFNFCLIAPIIGAPFSGKEALEK